MKYGTKKRIAFWLICAVMIGMLHIDGIEARGESRSKIKIDLVQLEVPDLMPGEEFPGKNQISVKTIKGDSPSNETPQVETPGIEIIGVEVESITWRVGDQEIQAAQKVEYGREYTADIHIMLKENFEFSQDVSVEVNGNVVGMDENHIVSCQFQTPRRTISSIQVPEPSIEVEHCNEAGEVINKIEPKLKEVKADIITEGAPATASPDAAVEWSNSWKEQVYREYNPQSTEDLKITCQGTIQDLDQYDIPDDIGMSQNIQREGNIFTVTITVTIKGKTSEIQSIDKAQISIAVPEPDKALVQEAECIFDGIEAQKTQITWKSGETTLNPGTIARFDTEYWVMLECNAPSGFQFSQNIVISLNGEVIENAVIEVNGSTLKLKFSFKTCSPPPPTIKPTNPPTSTPEPMPTVTPTGTPEPTPTVKPTSTPEPIPTPTVTPTGTPEPTPTVTPSGRTGPTPTPTITPTGTPEPTVKPTPTITPASTPKPTITPALPPVITGAPPQASSPAQSPVPKDSLLVVDKAAITLYAYCNVRSKPKKGIYVPKVKMEQTITGRYDKSEYTVKYISSNTRIASVSQTGRIRGIKMGKADIILRLYSRSDTSKVLQSRTVHVTVKPTLYMKHLTGKKFVVNGGKRYKNKRGVQFKIVGVTKAFYLFYKPDKKRYSIYSGKKWKASVKSIPKSNKTWIPLSGKKYYFYISADKKGKDKSKTSSNVICWNI